MRDKERNKENNDNKLQQKVIPMKKSPEKVFILGC